MPNIEQLEEIACKIGVSQVTYSKGVYTARRSYFYRMGISEDKIVQRIKEKFPYAEIIDKGDHWAVFRGGDSLRKGSHFWVKFKLPTVEEKMAEAFLKVSK